MSKISVIMATYNGEMYIREQLDSILNQTLLPDEIIIQDDGSTDNTVNIIKEYSAKNNIIKLNINKKNLGYIENFYSLLKQASGDYIFLSDQDDICLKTKYEEMVKVMESNDSIQILSCNPKIIDQNNSEINNIYVKKHKNDKTVEQVDWIKFVKLQTYNYLGMLFCIRKEFADNFVPMGYIHDISLAAEASINGGFYIYNSILQLYRQSLNNTIGISYGIKSRTKAIDSFIEKYEYYKRRYSSNKDVVDISQKMIELGVKRKKNYEDYNLIGCIKTKLLYNGWYGRRAFLGDLLSIIKKK